MSSTRMARRTSLRVKPGIIFGEARTNSGGSGTCGAISSTQVGRLAESVWVVTVTVNGVAFSICTDGWCCWTIIQCYVDVTTCTHIFFLCCLCNLEKKRSSGFVILKPIPCREEHCKSVQLRFFMLYFGGWRLPQFETLTPASRIEGIDVAKDVVFG